MLKSIVRDISYGILAGGSVTIGCAVYLACENKYVGALMFAVALLVICYMGYNLYTGKIGLIVASHTKQDFSTLLLGILGNVIGTVVFGTIIRFAIPNLHATAVTATAAKLAQSFGSALARGVFCGILMYLAVIVYKEKKSIVAILFCIPVFILCGFEHSIADMGYLAIAGEFSWQGLGYIWTIILGNTIGSILFAFLFELGKEKKNEN